ncbi:MAG: hypothetical protein JSV74_05615 [Dehalococcoidia bacterium]|nr:MAG: hypothetical protein JSV74_05615 [Dehalococcoidia bacterium]
MDEQNEKEGTYLNGVELPVNTISPTHKRELKKALFEYRKTNKATIFDEVLSSFQGVITTFSHILTSRQPVWRTSLVILVLVLVVSLSIIVPPLIGQDKEVIATDEITQILRSDNQTRALLDQGAIWNLMEKDSKQRFERSLDYHINKLEEEGFTIIGQEIILTIMASRMLVELVLANEYYYADVDIKNGEVLAIGQKGDPDLRAIDPRLDIDYEGIFYLERGGEFPFGGSMIVTRGFEGIESYIDPFYADTLFYYPSFDIPDLTTPPILE